MTLRRLLVLLLLPALLLAQALGLAHGVAHARLGSAVPVTQAMQATAGAEVHTASRADGLFAGHDAPQCRLYDQLAHGDGPPCVPTLAVPVLPPPLLVAVLQGLALARWAALFDARGPPALR